MRSLSLAVVLFATAAQAHFVLMSPTPTFQQGVLGDPQKAPPCGADGTEAASGAAVPTYAPGDQVELTLNETIFHPGHYRVALGETGPGSLPAEPATNPGGGYDCWTAVIQDPPVYPVLADNLLDHSTAFSSPQTVHVTLPTDKTCTHCTLQIIEFMSAHPFNNPGGCYYHHCVTINIAARDGGSSDAGAGGGAGGGSGASGGGTAGGASGATGGGASTGTGGGTAATGGSGGSGQTMGECGCSGGAGAALGLLSLLTLVSARRRK